MARHRSSSGVLLFLCCLHLPLFVPPVRSPSSPRVALRQGPGGFGAPLLGSSATLPKRLQLSEDRLKERVESYVNVLKTEMSPLLERTKIEGLTRFLHNFVKQKSRKKLLPLHPMLGLALRQVLPTASPETLAITSLALCYAGVREGTAWQELAKSVASGPQGFHPRALAELAWSFSEVRYAHQGVFRTLLSKMQEVKQITNEQEKSVFCWASGNLGFNCSAIFGPPSAAVQPQLAQKLFQQLDRLATSNGAVQTLAKDPYPLLKMPQALSPAVCQELIRRADQEGLWQNSTVVGGRVQQMVMNNIRTSATATFNLPHHEEDDLLYGIRSWAAQQLDLPTEYVEPLQIARYSRGQEYKRHFDWRSANFNGIWIFGQRVATILVYLNTLPQGGGETEFNQLNVQVTPMEGAAVIWPNVDVLGRPHEATSHQAKPVLQDGVTKYALNIWVTNKPYPNRTWIGWGR